MIVELHIIQNFAPSNLNRDDTGARLRWRPTSAHFQPVHQARYKESIPRARLAARGATGPEK